jgi:ABC-type sugar transport system substrate-binding protein
MPISKKIVVSLLTDKQSYQQKQAIEAGAAAALNGVQIDVLFADGSRETQTAQLRRYLENPTLRPFAIVVEPTTAEGLEDVARVATHMGVGWIVLNPPPPYLDYLRQEFPQLPIAVAVADNAQIGAVQAELVRTLLPNGGKIVSVEGPGGSASTSSRRVHMGLGLRGSNVEVIKVIGSDWTQAGAELRASWWLRLPGLTRPDLIVSQNDSMAKGVLDAIAKFRPAWGKVSAIGVDGQAEEGLQFVRDGILAATIIMPCTAGRGVDLAARALRGERISSVTVPVEAYPPILRLRKVG